MQTLNALRTAAQARGATLDVKGEGHFHIKGEVLVNYYPFSRRKTVYIPETNTTKYNVEPEQAVELAFPSCLG